jgi:hypothetical protein
MNLTCENYQIIVDESDKFLLCDEWFFDVSSLAIIAGVFIFIIILLTFIRKI